MFAQLGTIQFSGLQVFTSYSSSEEMAIAESPQLGTKPVLLPGGVGLESLELSIFLHVEFTPGSVVDEIAKLKTAMEAFEVLPLLWGNGDNGGNWVIKSLEIEYTNLDAQGNVYEARANVKLLESVNDNLAQQEQQAAANNAFAAGNKNPATKSKRKNPTSCPSRISGLVQEIQQFGALVNKIVSVYTGDQKQAAQVAQACDVISDDAEQIDLEVNTNKTSCVYHNATLGNYAGSVSANAQQLGGDFVTNAAAVNSLPTTGTVQTGTTIMAENAGLQAAIKRLVSAAASISKSAIVK